ncbi:DUF1127 domain-containing protein [Marinobacter sp. F4206]|uniref:DUF1127 domain-containing protein n=1 Tax=Marinobacter sp. F4206 TaxID=2861777 RepID=UPI001C5EA676|nr:hypothetical protein [Marinobacter sp. F4206]MBW4933183.1 hypothetical protein [Marinobacter sp. F4206]
MSTKTFLFNRLKIYLRNYRTRKALRSQLHGMSSRELDSLVRDIGIPGSELIQEASRPVWSTDVANDSRRNRHNPEDIALMVRSYCKNPPVA